MYMNLIMKFRKLRTKVIKIPKAVKKVVYYLQKASFLVVLKVSSLGFLFKNAYERLDFIINIAK